MVNIFPLPLFTFMNDTAILFINVLKKKIKYD